MNLTEQVEQALETIRPYLIADGGNVAIEENTDGIRGDEAGGL